MRVVAVVKVAAVIGLAAAGAVALRAQAKPVGCDPIGSIRFLCGVAGPEDFAVVPGADWIITSGNKAGLGAIRALQVRSQTITTLFPAPSPRSRPDARSYPGCPGPLDAAAAAEKSRIAFHGLYLKPGPAAVHTLFAVHHGSRESIEVFELDAAASPPALTWIGCVGAPDQGRFNAVVALPEGGVAATNVPATTPAAGQPAAAASTAGAVWEWHAGTGWKAVPRTEADRINGLEISPDGKQFYVSAWGEQSMLRVTRGDTPVRDVLAMPFRIDNLRRMADGSLLAAGHGGTALCSCPTETWHIGRIDPSALTVQELLRQPYVEGFGAATVAVQIGGEIWIGTNRGDRIGRFPVR